MIDEYENPRSADVPETIDGEYVDVPEAMESIANSWDQLDESEKNRVAEELVGHNHDEEINDTSSEDIPNFTGDDDDQEYHGEWSSIPIPDSTRDEKIRQDCTEEEMTDGTYNCIMAGR